MNAALEFEAFEELEPGPAWQGLFHRLWPVYRGWFLQEGESVRASYAEGLRMLRTHMPELVPLYERLCELAGGGDLEARMLSMWNPPSYLSGCSQGVWLDGAPVLVRNYDYAPSRIEGTILSTRWCGRRVIGSGDSLWGLLDGMNDAGLAVSLAFGGRRVIGGGFGVPLVVRYLLETCEAVDQAREVLTRLPYHLAHTLTLVDRSGDVLTAYLSPDRGVVFRQVGYATNHQETVEWYEHALQTRSVERELRLASLLGAEALTSDDFVSAFLRPPLYADPSENGIGTLYTAVYRPVEGSATYRWPGEAWEQSFSAFAPGHRVVPVAEASATSGAARYTT